MSKSRIVMIAPFLSAKYALEDLGTCSITAFLRKNGYDVKLVAVIQENENYDSIVEYNPDIVGITVYNHTIDMAYEIVRKIHRLLPQAKICIGGYGPTYYAKEILEEAPFIDFAIIGEGENSFLELVSSIDANTSYRDIKGLAFRENGSVVINEKHDVIEDLDSLPFISRDLLIDNKWKYGLIITTRGCTKNCFFCSGRDFWKTKSGYRWRARSITNVCDEMESLYQDLKIRQFWIADASFEDPGFNAERMKEFAREVIRRNLKITYFVCFRSDFYKKADPELMDLLKKSGLCEVFIGTEAVNSYDLKALGKIITVEDNYNCLDFFKQHDIYTEIGFINFNPYSTFEGLRQNADFLEKYRVACFFRCLSFLRIYKGCPVYENVKKDGLLKQSRINDDYCYAYQDSRVEQLAGYLRNYNDNILNNGKFLGSQMFVFQRYYGDRLVHFKKYYDAESAKPIYDLTVQHIANLDVILADLNLKVSDWFKQLLDLAETAWDVDQADQLTHTFLSEQYLGEVIRQFDQERLTFMKRVANQDRSAILYLSD